MDRLSYYAQKEIPFLFVIDYKKQNIFVEPIKTLSNIFFQTPLASNFNFTSSKPCRILSIQPISLKQYQKAFDRVQEEIKRGNTYLLNLTFPSTITVNCTLLEIFQATKAKFKLYFDDAFVCFSPERFVKIQNNTISTYPMKGTIDATFPNAKEKILNDAKEMAEHIMVVDLLRNDLNMVATNVKVTKFRYIDQVVAQEKQLLQVSSAIEGLLPKDWKKHLHTIFDKLLPAGSISGTPKRSTCQIIERVEQYDRGFYTGVFGIFDGKNLDSAVMIRFIEKTPYGYLYKSGGGITIDSNMQKEYQEMIDKIYVPV
ncbi:MULTISPECIES: aminodeoxychorismate synthase component I [unclassified Nitratiruptor]|uniref:aminodeoxychorismate synthase component I n=1 Tax=unclassified Nitratiruptor TaxID=2624044 RepID=UPI0019165E0F|nr:MULTISPECIES: aminodeoxychorismate synthase component I [unclassified Nitratiruptor]BCD59712.1 para-aminobenzoate synthetase component I [Nitratiruptor sp. YY08-10]BCD63636.1 para-aminobenzoate synthetase component I [Nitratiruptor sp. YY08-14]